MCNFVIILRTVLFDTIWVNMFYVKIIFTYRAKSTVLMLVNSDYKLYQICKLINDWKGVFEHLSNTHTTLICSPFFFFQILPSTGLIMVYGGPRKTNGCPAPDPPWTSMGYKLMPVYCSPPCTKPSMYSYPTCKYGTWKSISPKMFSKLLWHSAKN